MPVPPNDMVCRFIRKTDWSKALGKPKNKLFKELDISVWHPSRLNAMGAAVADLQFGSLEGSGQLMLTVQDYVDIASTVASRIKEPFEVAIKWRPEDTHVEEAWRPWREAHAQIEISEGHWANFPLAFRDLVVIAATKRQSIIPPTPNTED